MSPLSCSTPAVAERARISLARQLIQKRPAFRMAIALVPKNHPFRRYAQSTADDFGEFTDAILIPRGKAPLSDRAPAYYTWIVRGVFIWLILDTVSRHVPGPIGQFTGTDEAIRLFDRIANAASAFVS